MKRLHWTLAAAALLVLAAGFIPLHGLEVRASGGTGRVVLLKRVAPGDTFTISFIHSVEKSEVTDYFRIDDDHRIILYQSEFSSLNTGLPAVVSEGEVFEIQLWVHEDYGGSLSVDGKVVSLPALAGNGLLRISTPRVFAWELLPWAFRM
jgi:hypothetical protein